MPKLSDHQSAKITKLLLLGHSGAGKTGSLASLAKAGYTLWIIDADNGLDVLANILSGDPSALARVNFKTLTDTMKRAGPKLIPTAQTWTKVIETVMDWKEGEPPKSIGGINSWGPDDILVIDSLTFLGNAALQHILLLNGRLGQQPHQSDWYHAQNLIEGLLQTLYDGNVKCNVVILTHITYIGDDAVLQGFPSAVGKALSPKIGRYFNSMLMVKVVGQGTATKRQILTNVAEGIALKNTAPSRVPPSFPIESGLAEYFKIVRGSSPS